MKVKLLTPIEGYEDVAEWRIAKRGEHHIHATNKKTVCVYDNGPESYWNQMVLTPKPLPVVEPPKWLGVVQCGLGIYWLVFRIDKDKSHPLKVLQSDFSRADALSLESKRVKLIRTANIPTSPELEALFKE